MKYRSKTSRSIQSRGSSLVMALILTALLSYLVSRIFILTRSISTQNRITVHSDIAKHHTENALLSSSIEDIPEKRPDQTTKFKKFELTKTVGATSITRAIWSFRNIAPPELLLEPLINGALLTPDAQFPAFDYASLFGEEIVCETVPAQNSSVLSPGSIRSAASCVIKAGSISDMMGINANLEIYSLELQIPTSQPLSSLLVVGNLKIGVMNLVAPQALVVAAGDLGIDQIKAAHSETVTLVSATGKLRIGALSGEPKIKLIAKKGIESKTNLAPYLVDQSDSAPHPTLLKLEIMSLGKDLKQDLE